ncbi:unnamed protein product [Lota lota]
MTSAENDECHRKVTACVVKRLHPFSEVIAPTLRQAKIDSLKLKCLPVTPFMDRDTVSKPSSQTSFIRFVLLPLFTELTKLFP